MTKSEYYAWMRHLAKEVRETHGLSNAKVTLSDMRRIYKAYDIEIVYWDRRLKVARGQYTRDENGASVMVCRKLPDEVRIFTLAHELKHHLVDSDPIPAGLSDDIIEIGAEIFAAELIFPQDLFISHMQELGIHSRECTADALVHVKRHSATTLSYAGLVKLATFLGYATTGSFKGVQFKKLEEKLYGEPDFKRILRYRKARTVVKD